ncbi:SLAP domain-containing protein [Companilactobacillus farciminis]|uniref:SLAP domain-containing protein n=1 Tax=Companilactobacillus farciminis TaxID=1612 RepID=UPI00241CE279|nr:SLAP domain-containing protein [Companilactobacillus farciminis]
MRFQQLNRDPNSIMRKKLVKSKKNWIVVSSLSFAGGLLLLGGPAEIVHAADTTVAPTEQVATPTSSDSKTDATKTDSTKSADVTKAVAPVTTEENTDSTVQSDTVAPVEKETATTEKTDATDTNAVSETLNKETTTPDVEETGTTSEAQPVVAKDAQTTAESENTEALVSSPDVKDTQTTTEDVKNIDGEKVDTPVPDSDIATDETTDTTQSDINKENVIQNDGTQDDILAANLAVSKAQLASLGISAEDLTLTPEAEVLADGNIAEGTQGTTPWKIDADGILHLGTASETTAFDDNDATTNRLVSGESSASTSTSSATPSSPWDNYANNINTISFDGNVTASDNMNHMFANLNNLTTINNIDKLDMSNTSNASGMFMNDAKLTDIVSSNNTSHTSGNYDFTAMNFGMLKDTSDMFLNNLSVKTITFPNTVDTKGNTLKKVTNFNYMFKNNISLTNIDMKNWQFSPYGDTITMLGMFQNDYSLDSLNLRSWYMPDSVITGDSSLNQGMFDGTNLNSITLSSYNRFKPETALPSSTSNGMAEASSDTNTIVSGGKTFATIPGNTKYDYDLNSIVSHSGAGTNYVANAKADPATPIKTTMTVQTNMGPKQIDVIGTLYGAVSEDVPTETGYTADLLKVVGTIMPDSVVTNNYVTYTRNATTTTVSTSKGAQTIDVPAGVVGTTSDPITLPTINGYDSPQIKVQYTKDGNVITDLDGNAISDTNEAKYTGSEVTLKSPAVNDKTNFTVRDSENNILDDGSQVHVDDQVSIIPPVVEGYTPYINGEKIPENGISGTIGTDGSFIPDDSTINLSEIEYKGNEIKPTIPTISAPDKSNTSVAKDSSGNTISPDQTLHVGDSVTITLPTQDGYKAFNNGKEITTVAGTIDVGGNFIPNDSSIDLSNIKYIGNEITPKIPTISTPNGKNDSVAKDSSDKTISPDQTLHVGDSVTITLPTQDGYKAFNNGKEITTVAGTIDVGGNFIPDDSSIDLSEIEYKGNEITPKIPTISTPDGKNNSVVKDNSDNTISPDQMLHVGDSVTITLPTQDGYKAFNNGKEITTVAGTIDVGGNFIPNDSSIDLSNIKYIGNEVAPTIPIISTPNNKETSAVIDSNNQPVNANEKLHVGDKVTVSIPTQNGYHTVDKDNSIITATESTGTIGVDGNFVPDEGNVDPAGISYIGDSKQAIINNVVAPDKSTGITTVNGKVTNNGDEVHVGDKVTVSIPTQSGYHIVDENGNTVTAVESIGTIDINGYFKPDDNQVNPAGLSYVGDSKQAVINNVVAPNKEAGTTIDANGNIINNGDKVHVGDKITVSIPNQNGYHTVDNDGNTITTAESTGTIGVDGNFVPDEGQVNPADISYVGDSKKAVITNLVTPNKTTGSTTDKDGKTITNGDEVHVGDKVAVSIPTQDGYHIIDKNGDAVTATESTGIIGVDGNFIPDENQVDPTGISYVGNSKKAVITNLVTPNKTTGSTTDKDGKTITNGDEVHVGDKVTVSIPTQNGYHTIDKEGNTITATESTGTIGVDGNFVPDEGQVNPVDISYAGDSKQAVINNIETPNNTTGSTTDKNGKTITNGDEVHVGDKVTVSIPTQNGYHIVDNDGNTITATESTGIIGTDGKFVPDEGQVNPTHISYIGDKVTPNINSISTPDKTSGTVTDENGNPINDDEDVHVGDKVSINLPTQNGYHLEDNDGKTIDNTKLTGTVGPNGEFVPGSNSVDPNAIKYVGNLNKSTTINLKTPDGIVPLGIPAGHFGDEPVTITAPSISGYTAPSIIVTFGANGIPTIVDAKTPDKEISTSDTLTYSRIPSSHTIIQKDTEKTDIATPKQNSQNVATYSEKGQILLYTLGEDNKMTAISNYGLAKQSTWYSDEQITVDGIQYLRVATNKWVKASQVYSYQDLNQYVRTYDKTAKVLYKSEDEVINNRILQPNTSWFSDRTTYVINGDKYYRVATNEFVSAKDVYIYQPTNMVVKTHTDSPSKNLYTAKGELITNRSLVADSNWLVDSIVYIEGIKYYRVATNEFVKASDVDINH